MHQPKQNPNFSFTSLSLVLLLPFTFTFGGHTTTPSPSRHLNHIVHDLHNNVHCRHHHHTIAIHFADSSTPSVAADSTTSPWKPKNVIKYRTPEFIHIQVVKYKCSLPSLKRNYSDSSVLIVEKFIFLGVFPLYYGQFYSWKTSNNELYLFDNSDDNCKSCS